ncbi:hypothetical protein HYPBUDRAFT_151617 [Hyphopichia burtonii NRRL Y-1933]|uniref:Uncharacterized protein n=1 Tax=Hyphopichia burtonii NRRL Y-1933 TaxID=984485 RepID=A0A1E4RSD1_9ASCO|nr:hypothetical protein HYPBUDRAFT_151617 [Hyphopichia burtonii NRRL Y-1933]ODV70192.1 hypothetical protein HYPBUDRAFT_151617 [Hyphopichia burtonii NRRL Y-1933]
MYDYWPSLIPKHNLSVVGITKTQNTYLLLCLRYFMHVEDLREKILGIVQKTLLSKF